MKNFNTLEENNTVGNFLIVTILFMWIILGIYFLFSPYLPRLLKLWILLGLVIVATLWVLFLL